MSVPLTALAYRATIGPAPPTATRPKVIDAKIRKAVLVRAAFAAQDDGSRITIGAATIARQLEMGKRTVQYTLDSLVHDGILRRVSRGGGRGHTTAYAINVARLSQLAGEPGNGAPRAPKRPTANSAPGAPLQPRNGAPSTRNDAPSALNGAPCAPDRQDRHTNTAPRRARALDARASAADGPLPIGEIPNPSVRAAIIRFEMARAEGKIPVPSDDVET